MAPYLAFLFICFCWGGSFILMDRAALAYGPVAVGFGRLAGGAAALAIYCLVRKQSIRPTLIEWGHIAVVAVLSNALPYVVQPYVMRQAGEHGFFGLMVTFVPLATILASAVMLRIWPTPRQWLGVVGGLACALVIARDGSDRGIAPHLLAMSLSVPAVYAVGNTYLRWKLQRFPPAPLTAAFLGLGAVLLTPLLASSKLLAAAGLAGPAAPQQVALASAALLTLGVLSTGAAVLAFVHLIQTQGPLFAGMVTYVVPMIALLWGQYDGERLTRLQLAAIGGVLAMVALVQWGAARELAAEEASVTAEPGCGVRESA